MRQKKGKQNDQIYSANRCNVHVRLVPLEIPYVNVETNAWLGRRLHQQLPIFTLVTKVPLVRVSSMFKAAPALVNVDGEEAATEISGKGNCWC